MPPKDLHQDLLNLIAPKEVTENFDLKEITEKKDSIIILFEEKPERIPEELERKEVVMDGFVNTLELQTFPLKDKTVYIALRRRRWKEKSITTKSFSNTYDLHYKGMKTTKEFGIFLKEELGLQPAEYNKLWRSLTN
ncbi:MAG: hypothetical protein WCH34_03335 [Bacteroidota bacterium]